MKIKLVPANLTVETFIQRTMLGEVFYFKNIKCFYDKSKTCPFRVDNDQMHEGDWDCVSVLCTREPVTWEDEVSEDNPVLCWVRDESSIQSMQVKKVIRIDRPPPHIYDCSDGTYYDYATPVQPSDCWGFEGDKDV